jgi:hypothetical protein
MTTPVDRHGLFAAHRRAADDALSDAADRLYRAMLLQVAALVRDALSDASALIVDTSDWARYARIHVMRVVSADNRELWCWESGEHTAAAANGRWDLVEDVESALQDALGAAPPRDPRRYWDEDVTGYPDFRVELPTPSAVNAASAALGPTAAAARFAAFNQVARLEPAGSEALDIPVLATAGVVGSLFVEDRTGRLIVAVNTDEVDPAVCLPGSDQPALEMVLNGRVVHSTVDPLKPDRTSLAWPHPQDIPRSVVLTRADRVYLAAVHAALKENAVSPPTVCHDFPINFACYRR